MPGCPNPPCPEDVLLAARQQGAFGITPEMQTAQPDAAAAPQPWKSLGNPHDDYEALLGLFQKGLAMRRAGQNPDQFVQQQLGHTGAKSMKDLASMLAFVAKAGGEDVPKPSAAASAVGGALDAASAGTGTQIHGLAKGIDNLILGGAFAPGYRKGVGEYQQGMENAYSAHPVATTAGGIGGAVGGGLLLPSGAVMDAELGAPFRMGSIAGQTGERSLVPGLARGIGTGAAAGYGTGLLHQDLTHPDFKSPVIPGAIGAGTGGVLGLARASYNALQNPAQFYLNRALSFDEPLIEESLRSPQPAGNPTLLEQSPTLVSNAQTLARVNRPAAVRAVRNLDAEATKVAREASGISNDPAKGYDAIFENRWLGDPETMKAWNELTGETTVPSARDVFDKYKSMRRFVNNTTSARMKGTVVRPEDDATAIDYTQKMNTFANALADVPGFNELQEKLAPYLQRRTALGQLRSMLQRRARGQLGEDPKRGLVESMLQDAGLSPHEAKWRAAGDLLDLVTKPNNARTIPEMRTLLNPTIPFPFQTNRLPGSVPAAAGLLAGTPTGNQQ